MEQIEFEPPLLARVDQEIAEHERLLTDLMKIVRRGNNFTEHVALAMAMLDSVDKKRKTDMIGAIAVARLLEKE